MQVSGGNAGALTTESEGMCRQEFEFRLAGPADGMLVVEAPVDTSDTGVDYGRPGHIWSGTQEVLTDRGRIHKVALTVPSVPGVYRLAFYAMRDGEAIGDPFNFDYEVNCHGLVREQPSYGTSTVVILVRYTTVGDTMELV